MSVQLKSLCHRSIRWYMTWLKWCSVLRLVKQSDSPLLSRHCFGMSCDGCTCCSSALDDTSFQAFITNLIWWQESLPTNSDHRMSAASYLPPLMAHVLYGRHLHTGIDQWVHPASPVAITTDASADVWLGPCLFHGSESGAHTTRHCRWALDATAIDGR
jgi:hypothetical protein